MPMSMDAAEAPPSPKRPLTNFIFIHRATTTLHDMRRSRWNSFTREMYAPTIYVYDGAEGYRFYGLNYDQGYGRATTKNPRPTRVSRTRDQPARHRVAGGRLRFYRRDDDGQLQFVGENTMTTRRATRPSA